jgi:hypothetical protein
MAFTQQAPIGAPDVNLITKTLAGLQPDSALQQYAMMHKNNPYIVSLAKSESDRRKSLRTAAQGQVGQQPTVVDQDIANMAPAPRVAQTQPPEQQGIAQLPTPNVQNMADGGIAGYDEEQGMATGGMGGMFNFTQQSEPVVRMSGGGHIPRYQGSTRDGSVVSSNPMFNIPGMTAVQPRAEFTQQGDPENTPFFQRIIESVSSSNKERQLAAIEQKIAQGTATADEKAFYQTEKIKASPPTAAGAPILPYGQSKATNVLDNAPPPPAVKKVIDSASQASSKVAGNYPNTAEGYRQRLDVLAGTAAEAKDPFASQQGEIAAEEKAASLERKAEFEKGIAARGEAFKGREGRLTERETRLGKEDERNTGLALLEAGLGMMTSRGPGLSGIAEGAKAGVASFAAGKQRMLAAKEKLDDARDQIEEYRRNEANMTDKERRAMNDDINRTVIQSKKDALAGVKQAYGVNKTEALKLLEVSAADKRAADENASRERAAGAGSPQALYRLLGGGDLEKGMRLATEIQAGKKTMAQSYEDYMKAFAGKDTTVSPPLTPQEWVKQVNAIKMLESGKPPAPMEGTPTRQ